VEECDELNEFGHVCADIRLMSERRGIYRCWRYYLQYDFRKFERRNGEQFPLIIPLRMHIQYYCDCFQFAFLLVYLMLSPAAAAVPSGTAGTWRRAEESQKAKAEERRGGEDETFN
jgi:hypothetical protein